MGQHSGHIQRYGGMWRWQPIMLWLLLLLSVGACSNSNGGGLSGTSATPTLALDPLATPQETPFNSSLATEVPRPTATPGPTILIIWAPLELTPAHDHDGGTLLRQYVAEFQAQHPAIQIKYEPKEIHGRAGLLQLLRASSLVAPAIMPDIIILPSSDFPEAAQAGLCQPIERLLPAKLSNFFPLVVRDGVYGESLLGIPLLVTIDHLVYRPQPDIPPPTTWDAFLTAQQRFLFPVGDPDAQISDAFLLQYAALTTQLPQGRDPLEREAIQQILEFYNQASNAGLIPAQVTTLDTSTESWQQFLAGYGELAETDSRTYLSAPPTETTGVAYGPVPTHAGQSATIADGYILAVTTADQTRQQAVATYLDWLLTPSRLGRWANSYHWLPTEREALTIALPDPAYQRFIAALLETAYLRPGGPEWAPVSQTLNQQVREVLAGRITPQKATDTILGASMP